MVLRGNGEEVRYQGVLRGSRGVLRGTKRTKGCPGSTRKVLRGTTGVLQVFLGVTTGLLRH